jgi:hypothetical protein
MITDNMTDEELVEEITTFANRVQSSYDHIDLMVEAAKRIRVMSTQHAEAVRTVPIGFANPADVAAINDNLGGVMSVSFEALGEHKMMVLVREVGYGDA